MAGAEDTRTCDPVGAQCSIAIIAALLLSGCACSAADWDPTTVSRAKALGAIAEPNCDGDQLARYSKASSSFMERADPLMLEIARLEAERDCYRAAERRARLGSQPSSHQFK
jgi:hypothetical protein